MEKLRNAHLIVQLQFNRYDGADDDDGEADEEEITWQVVSILRYRRRPKSRCKSHTSHNDINDFNLFYFTSRAFYLIYLLSDRSCNVSSFLHVSLFVIYHSSVNSFSLLLYREDNWIFTERQRERDSKQSKLNTLNATEG